MPQHSLLRGISPWGGLFYYFFAFLLKPHVTCINRMCFSVRVNMSQWELSSHHTGTSYYSPAPHRALLVDDGGGQKGRWDSIRKKGTIFIVCRAEKMYTNACPRNFAKQTDQRRRQRPVKDLIWKIRVNKTILVTAFHQEKESKPALMENGILNDLLIWNVGYSSHTRNPIQMDEGYSPLPPFKTNKRL